MKVKGNSQHRGNKKIKNQHSRHRELFAKLNKYERMWHLGKKILCFSEL